MEEVVVEELPKSARRRYTIPTFVKFGPGQREILEEIAEEQGMSLSQVVRQAAVVHYDLPRESRDLD